MAVILVFGKPVSGKGILQTILVDFRIADCGHAVFGKLFFSKLMERFQSGLSFLFFFQGGFQCFDSLFQLLRLAVHVL